MMAKKEKSISGKSLWPPLNSEALQSFESEIGAELPKDFREFLERTNGFDFDEPQRFGVIEPLELDVEPRIEVIYGIAEDEHEVTGIPAEQFSYDFVDRVPDNIIAIGETDLRQRLCVSVSGANRGSIFLWCPGIDWDDPPDHPYDELRLLARSFTEFWQSLGAD